MKNLFRLIFIVIISHTIETGFSEQPNQSERSIDSQIFLSSSLPSSEKDKKGIENLTNTVSPYPLRGIISEKNLLAQGVQSRRLKASLPAKTVPLLQKSHLSILKSNPDQFKKYPSGAQLFPKYPQLSSQFDAMINQFKREPDFIPLFRKIHINVLNELYHYLIGIFMNFNLQHQGMIQKPDGHLASDIPTYLTTEETYDINKKTMIINHLMSIIESQFNGAIKSYVSYIPQSFATYIGRTAIQNDYSTDLTHLIIEHMEPELAKLKLSSLQALSEYVLFFQNLTSYLDKQDTKSNPHFKAFVDIAKQINIFLYGDKQANIGLIEEMQSKSPAAYYQADTAGASEIKKNKSSAKAWAKGIPYPKEASITPTKNSHLINNDRQLIALAKMNPPIFHFGYDDIRALKLIPYLAKKISPKTKMVPWPEHIKEAANEMILLKTDDGPHPIAYFKTKDNKMVRYINNPNEADLYLCMRLGSNLFEQILIPEPKWLSHWEGILKILKAAYGDFTAILGMDILDPVTEAIIANVVKIQNGKEPESMAAITQKAINLIDSWKQTNQQIAQQTDQSFSNVPTLSSLSSPINSELTLPPLSSLQTPSLVSQP
jgi:hypothetical protein